MKALLLSFFMFILCYSLFFERDTTPMPVDEINYTIRTEAYEYTQIPDSSTYYADNLYKSNHRMGVDFMNRSHHP